MKRFAFAAVAVVLILSACVDEQDTARITTAPKAPRAISANAQASGGSTVCKSYSKDLVSARTTLQASPEDGALQDKVASLDAMIADACQ